jgi:hypothetical protein
VARGDRPTWTSLSGLHSGAHPNGMRQAGESRPDALTAGSRLRAKVVQPLAVAWRAGLHRRPPAAHATQPATPGSRPATPTTPRSRNRPGRPHAAARREWRQTLSVGFGADDGATPSRRLITSSKRLEQLRGRRGQRRRDGVRRLSAPSMEDARFPLSVGFWIQRLPVRASHHGSMKLESQRYIVTRFTERSQLARSPVLR